MTSTRDTQVHSSLIREQIQTQQKTVRLEPYNPFGVGQSFESIQIASKSICAFYHTDCRAVQNFVAGAIPSPISHSTSPPPEMPPYRASPKSIRAQGAYYTEAPLTGVSMVKLCMEEERCIGLFLQYSNYNRTVGQFRYDKVVGHSMKGPLYILVKNSGGAVHLTFADKPTSKPGYQCQPMTGHIVWWYDRERSEVSLEA